MHAWLVRVLCVKAGQRFQHLGVQGLPGLWVQQQGVAVGQGDALQAWGHGRLALAAQALQVR